MASITIHTALIDHPKGNEFYHSICPEKLEKQIATYCRENWDLDREPPADDGEMMEAFTEKLRPLGYDTYINRNEFELSLPQPFASTNHLLEELEAIRHLALNTRAIGLAARRERIAWLAGKAIESAGEPIPSLPTFTVFCLRSNSSTIWTAPLQATDADEAKAKGIQAFLADLNDGDEPGDENYSEDDIQCLGVAAGDIQILHWEDINN